MWWNIGDHVVYVYVIVYVIGVQFLKIHYLDNENQTGLKYSPEICAWVYPLKHLYYSPQQPARII